MGVGSRSHAGIENSRWRSAPLDPASLSTTRDRLNASRDSYSGFDWGIPTIELWLIMIIDPQTASAGGRFIA